MQASVRYYLCFSKTEREFGECLSLSDWETSLYCVISRWCSQYSNDVRADIYWAIQRQALFDMLSIYFGHRMVFPVVMYGCESWTVKKAERRRIDAFELWCWRRLLRVPWTARRSNQSILKEISSGFSLEGMMLKLKLLYFGHLMRRVELTGKDPDAGRAGGEGDDRGWDGWMVSPTRWTWVWVNSRSWW